MLIVQLKEVYSILNDEKVETLRPIKPNGKGYFKIGSIQQIRTSRNFKEPYLCRVIILARDFIDLRNMSDPEFKPLGYPNKAEYLAQAYNLRNKSPYRVRYSFMRLERFAEYVESLEIDPEAFGEIWDICKDNKDLNSGVDPSQIFEGCDPEILEAEYIALQSNIRGMIE